MAFESFTEIGCIIVVTRRRDSAGNLIVVALEANGRDANRTVNLCKTAFGKEHEGWFSDQTAAKRLLYVDLEKGHGIPEVSSLPLEQQTEPLSHDPQQTRY